MSDQKIIETPVNYSGLWIAWDADHKNVIASGKTMEETREKARKKTDKFWLDKVPEKESFFVGASSLKQ